MVKLEANDPQYKNAVFYFQTMEECKEFLHAFENHMCNVPWMEPVEATSFPEMTERDRQYMLNGQSPTKKAERNLSWGFCMEKRLGIGLTSKQKGFVSSLMAALDTKDGGTK
ncbi:MAG: hypothetical protein NC311_06445 [Muribaculaceae bacterium]|nr:hypothetical protein [Muribaculaceae bacterium]